VGRYFVHGPRLLEFLNEMKQKALSPYDTLTVGEALFATTEQAAELTNEQTGPLDMVFHFEHVVLDTDPQAALELIHKCSRDNARTPMQWTDGENGGFTTGRLWIGVNPNHTRVNVEQAMADPESVFHYYRRLIALRKTNPVIVHGRYDLILDDDEDIYAFTRTLEDDRLLVILNFTASTPTFVAPPYLPVNATELLIANYPVDAAEDLRRLPLRPFEARVYRLR
jgi:oligo-1,6-glucosidase